MTTAFLAKHLPHLTFRQHIVIYEPLKQSNKQFVLEHSELITVAQRVGTQKQDAVKKTHIQQHRGSQTYKIKTLPLQQHTIQ